jgi:hypothetical protein
MGARSVGCTALLGRLRRRRTAVVAPSLRCMDFTSPHFLGLPKARHSSSVGTSTCPFAKRLNLAPHDSQAS